MSGTEELLDELVHQFGDPFDALRELVQNALDAETARIVVRCTYDEGVLALAVVDRGRGMDEEIIQAQLTRLFASGKAGDRTTIGKFGIGFVSVFALRPRAVQVLTGRHGEAWEVVFLPDRTFRLLPRPDAIQGTTVTLFLDTLQPEASVRRARASLLRWCRHVPVPLLLEHLDGSTERLDAPLRLGLAHEKTCKDGPVTLCAALGGGHVQTYHSGGLLLHRIQSPGELGSRRERLGRVDFLIDAPGLTHTLSRDSIVEDAEWQQLMGRLEGLVDELVAEELHRLAGAARAGDVDGVVDSHHRLDGVVRLEELTPDQPLAVGVSGPLDRRALLGLDPFVTYDEHDVSLARELADRGVLAVHARCVPSLVPLLPGVVRFTRCSEHFAKVLPLADGHPSSEAFERLVEVVQRRTAGRVELFACRTERNDAVWLAGTPDGTARPVRRAPSAWQQLRRRFAPWAVHTRASVNCEHPHLSVLLQVPDDDVRTAAWLQWLAAHGLEVGEP